MVVFPGRPVILHLNPVLFGTTTVNGIRVSVWHSTSHEVWPSVWVSQSTGGYSKNWTASWCQRVPRESPRLAYLTNGTTKKNLLLIEPASIRKLIFVPLSELCCNFFKRMMVHNLSVSSKWFYICFIVPFIYNSKKKKKQFSIEFPLLVSTPPISYCSERRLKPN